MKAKLRILLLLLVSIVLITACKSEKEKMLSEGDEKFFDGDFLGAAKIYSDVKKSHPDYLLAYIRRANCELCYAKKFDSFIGMLTLSSTADEKFSRVINRISFSGDEIFSSFNTENRRNRILSYSNEIEFLTDAISKSNGKPIFYFARGMWYYLLDQNTEALKDFETVSAKDPNFLESKLMQARIYSRSNLGHSRNYSSTDLRNNFKALKLYNELLKNEQRKTEFILETAFCYGNLGQSEAAYETVNNAYKEDSTNTDLLESLVWSYRVLGRTEESKRYMEKLLKIFPNKKKSYQENYANILYEAGEIDKAVKIMRKLQEMAKPNGYEVLRLQSLIDVMTMNKRQEGT